MFASAATLLTTCVALVAVLGLIVLAGRAARATGLARGGPNQRLALRESIALDRTRSLRIVSCDGRELLVLVGGGADVVIGWLPPGEPRP